MDAFVIAVVSGLLVGLSTGWIFYRLTVRADRKPAFDTGQFSRGDLRLIVDGWPVKPTDSCLSFVHVLDDGFDDKAVGSLMVHITNMGQKVLEEVMLNIRMPLIRGFSEFQKQKQGFLPGTKTKREVVGNFVQSYTYVRSLAPGTGIGVEEPLQLKPTQITSSTSVETEGQRREIVWTLQFAARATISTVSRDGLGPAIDVSIAVYRGGLIETAREIVRRVDEDERKEFGLDGRSIFKPWRHYQFTHKRPALRMRYLVHYHHLENTTDSEEESAFVEGNRDSLELKCFGVDWLLLRVMDGKLEAIKVEGSTQN